MGIVLEFSRTGLLVFFIYSFFLNVGLFLNPSSGCLF